MSVTRRVDFFLALTAEAADGRRPPYDINPALAAVRRKAWRDRYTVSGERVLRLWPYTQSPAGMLGLVRRSALPPVDRGSSIGELGLGPDEGIVEQMFFKVFDSRYLAVVRQQYGPRPARLAAYLDEVAPAAHHGVTFLPLARTDVFEQLAGARHVRKFRLKVLRSAVQHLADEGTIYDLLEPVSEASDTSATIEIELSVGRKQHVGLGRRWIDAAKRLAQRDDIGDVARQFQLVIDDEDDDRHEINVLDDRITSVQEIRTTSDRARRLSDRSAFEALDNAYSECSDELEHAAALQLER